MPIMLVVLFPDPVASLRTVFWGLPLWRAKRLQNSAGFIDLTQRVLCGPGPVRPCTRRKRPAQICMTLKVGSQRLPGILVVSAVLAAGGACGDPPPPPTPGPSVAQQWRDEARREEAQRQQAEAGRIAELRDQYRAEHGTAPTSKSLVGGATAIQQMELAFIGNPSQRVIRS